MLLISVLMWLNNDAVYMSSLEALWTGWNGSLDISDSWTSCECVCDVCDWSEVKWSEVTGSEVKWSEDIWMQPGGRADCWCPKVNSHRDLRKQIVDHNSRIQNEETWSDFIIFCRYIQRSDRVSCGPCVVMMSSALSIIWKKNQLLVFIYRSYSGSRRWTRTSPLDCRVQMILADRSVSAAQRQFPQCWVKLCRRTWCFGVQQAGGGAARRGAARSASGCLFRLINSVSLRAVVNTC